MDWLSKHKAKIDCTQRQIIFEEAEGKEDKMEGEKVVSPPCFISVAKARKLLQKGCPAYLCSILTAEGRKAMMQDVPVVRNF